MWGWDSSQAQNYSWGYFAFGVTLGFGFAAVFVAGFAAAFVVAAFAAGFGAALGFAAGLGLGAALGLDSGSGFCASIRTLALFLARNLGNKKGTHLLASQLGHIRRPTTGALSMRPPEGIGIDLIF